MHIKCSTDSMKVSSVFCWELWVQTEKPVSRQSSRTSAVSSKRSKPSMECQQHYKIIQYSFYKYVPVKSSDF